MRKVARWGQGELGGDGRAAGRFAARARDCITCGLPEFPRDGFAVHVPLLPVMLSGCIDVFLPYVLLQQ
jgi:hypothetical protein